MQSRLQGNVTVGRESLGELVGELANTSSALIRDEIELAKQEISEKIAALRKGTILLIAAAWIGSFAVLSLLAAGTVALGHSVGLVYSMLIIGGTLLLITAALGALGIRRFEQTSLKPEQTIETLREDKEWLKELA